MNIYLRVLRKFAIGLPGGTSSTTFTNGVLKFLVSAALASSRTATNVIIVVLKKFPLGGGGRGYSYGYTTAIGTTHYR